LVNAGGGELGHEGRRCSRGEAARGIEARVRGEGGGGLYRRGARGLPWRARPGPAGCRCLAAAASGLARWASPGLATGLAGAVGAGRAFGLGLNRKDSFFSNLFFAKPIPEKSRN
jgi:hypothetical protein